MRIPTITTARLTLRAFTAGDAEPLHRVLSDRDVLRYFPNTDPPSQDRVEKLISDQLAHWETRGYGWWAVELRSKSGLIGWSGLQFLPETDEVEVAYLLGKALWGQGLATEAARACLQYAFENLELDTIVAIVHPDNIASQRVIEKLGMSFVDRSPYFGMDCYRYSIERHIYEQWRASTAWGQSFERYQREDT